MAGQWGLMSCCYCWGVAVASYWGPGAAEAAAEGAASESIYCSHVGMEPSTMNTDIALYLCCILYVEMDAR